MALASASASEEGEVLSIRKDGNIMEVSHKSIGFPTEKPHYLDITAETHGMEEDII